MAATLLIGIACAWTGLNLETIRAWHQNLTTDGETGGVYYPSSYFMAHHVGCTGTFRPASQPGASATSGECDLPNGAHLEFRTFTSTPEALAWFEGTQGQAGRLEDAYAGGVGANWAIRVTGRTDEETLKAVFSSLPS